MACAITQGYTLGCRDSVAGSKKFYIIAWDDIASMTLLAGVITALTKDSTKQFYEYAQEAGVAECDEQGTGSRENGSFFVSQSVKIVMNKRQVATRNELMLVAKNRVAIVELDNNNEAWLYGYGNGLLVEGIGAKSGKARGDRNGYEVEFKGDENEFAYSVQAAVVATLTTPGT